MTKEERIVWRWLRDRRLEGIKFRRQHPILNYIADFYCAELKLIVEIDGSGHETPAQDAYDVRRDIELSKLGIDVIRIRNQDVTHHQIATGDCLIAEVHQRRSKDERRAYNS
jgi:uroporphyrinogen-III synthase